MKTAVALYCKNEQHIIGEWLAYHIHLGFDTVFIYDNISTDGTAEIVRRAQDVVGTPQIVYQNWPDELGKHSERQRLAYTDALRRCRSTGIEWLAAIDADEFILSRTSESLSAMLERLNPFAAIALHWKFYGSGGHVKQPRGLVTENFLYCCKPDFISARGFKSIVRVPYCQGFFNAHAGSFGPEFHYVNSAGEPVTWSQDIGFVTNRLPVFQPWFLGHYFCQSREQWVLKEMRSNTDRSNSPRSAKSFLDHDRNEDLDFTALRHSSAIRDMMRQLNLPEPPWPEPHPIEKVR